MAGDDTNLGSKVTYKRKTVSDNVSNPDSSPVCEGQVECVVWHALKVGSDVGKIGVSAKHHLE